MLISFLSQLDTSLVLSVVSLIITIFSGWLTYITYINPILRFQRYLSTPEDWLPMRGLPTGTHSFRNRKWSNYSVSYSENDDVCSSFYEEWCDEIPVFDTKHNWTTYVKIENGSTVLDAELFVSLDGNRYFIPVPSYELINGVRNYYFSEQQRLLFLVVGRNYHEEKVDEFLLRLKWPIKYFYPSWSRTIGKLLGVRPHGH